MILVTLDFETYYDKDYSLSKMQTDAYVLDDRFEAIGVSIQLNEDVPRWFPKPKVEDALAAIDWANVWALCHHAAFDGFILKHRFGHSPKMWLDTLSMSRALYPWLPSHSLKSLAEYHGVGAKGTEVISALGKHYDDFTPAELNAYGAYCCNDTALTKAVYDIMAPDFPALEYALVDETIRMFTEPALQLDGDRLATYRDGIIASKQKLVDSVTADRDQLMSNPKFASVLQQLGVFPPMKISKTTNKLTYAFAKTDEALTDLLDHPNPDVQAVVAARLGVKTTIAETRAQRLVETAARGIGMPVFLNYWGAKTTGRYSGGNLVNMQNIPNRGADRVIRECLVAPEGHAIVVGDSSNIELRTNMVMCGQTDMVAKIRMYDAQGKAAVSDVYCEFASLLFGRTVTKADKMERSVGKTGELSLGYSAGEVAFQNMLRVQAGINWALDACRNAVAVYRSTHDQVTRTVSYLGSQILPCIANRDVMQSVDVNGWFLTTEEGFAIPGQLGVAYKDLRRNSENEWEYTQGRGRVKIYGGKVLENLNQHAARHIVMWQLARVARKYKVVLTVHDEIVCVVPIGEAEKCAAYVLECLHMSPPWCRGLIPLAGEVGIGSTYAEAK